MKSIHNLLNTVLITPFTGLNSSTTTYPLLKDMPPRQVIEALMNQLNLLSSGIIGSVIPVIMCIMTPHVRSCSVISPGCPDMYFRTKPFLS